jgi:hypothetical protein
MVGINTSSKKEGGKPLLYRSFISGKETGEAGREQDSHEALCDPA